MYGYATFQETANQFRLALGAIRKQLLRQIFSGVTC
jgi:hypothetical protein